MTKIQMPEPVAWITRTKTIGPDYGKESFGKLPVQSLNPLTYEHEPLITTEQAEAYADARVREALLEAYRSMQELHMSLMNDATPYVHPARIANFAANRISALIPTTK